MVDITISAFGEVEMSRTLTRFAESAENMIPAFDMIRDNFFDLEREQFEGQGVYSGGWAPLADSTVAAKARAGIDPRIMFGATEDLFKSLTGPNPQSVYEVTTDEMVIGSSVPYGVYHQSRDARSRLPRRPLVELDDQHKVEWVKILQSWLVGRHGSA